MNNEVIKPVKVGLFSIRNRVILSVAAAIMLPLIIISVVATVISRQNIENSLSGQLQSLANTEAGLIQLVLSNQLNLLVNLANIQEIELFVRGSALRYDGTPEEIEAQLLEIDQRWIAAPDSDPLILQTLSNLITPNLTEFLRNTPGHMEIMVTDAYGALVAATNRTSDYYQADEAWWQNTWNNGEGAVYIADQFTFDESIGEDVLVISLPIERNGVPIGVLRSNYTAAQMSSLISAESFAQTGRLLLMREDGTVLASSDRVIPDAPLSAIAAGLNTPDLFRATDENGTTVVMGSVPVTTRGAAPAIDNLNWSMVFLQAEEEAFAATAQTLQTILVYVSFVLVLSLVIAYVLSRFITQPLADLTAAAQEIATQRNWSRRVNIGGRTEFDLLGSAFNQMAQEVQNTLGTLEERVAERTRDLQIVADVTNQASTILQVDRLLQDVVDLTKERFGLYHAHVYLLDESETLLELVAGAGHVGRQMVAETRVISMDNENSIVARAASTRRGQMVNDVSISPLFLPHPLLPDTRSELAVPLVARGSLVGVLDIQSDDVNAFTPEILGVMELLASQVSSSIINARLFENAQQTSRHEAALGQIDREIQRATSVDEILQVAVRELGKALRVPHTAVELQLANVQQDTKETAQIATEAGAQPLLADGDVAHHPAVEHEQGNPIDDYEEVTSG